jgi:hypothetical protein
MSTLAITVWAGAMTGEAAGAASFRCSDIGIAVNDSTREAEGVIRLRRDAGYNCRSAPIVPRRRARQRRLPQRIDLK